MSKIVAVRIILVVVGMAVTGTNHTLAQVGEGGGDEVGNNQCPPNIPWEFDKETFNPYIFHPIQCEYAPDIKVPTIPEQSTADKSD